MSRQEVNRSTAMDHFPGHRLALGLVAAVLAVWSVFTLTALDAAALSPEAGGDVVVVFPMGVSSHRAYDAIIRAGGGVLEKSLFANAWIARSEEPGFVGRLLAQGAWRAFDPVPIQPLLIAGCFATATARVDGR